MWYDSNIFDFALNCWPTLFFSTWLHPFAPWMLLIFAPGKCLVMMTSNSATAHHRSIPTSLSLGYDPKILSKFSCISRRIPPIFLEVVLALYINFPNLGPQEKYEGHMVNQVLRTCFGLDLLRLAVPRSLAIKKLAKHDHQKVEYFPS